MKIIILAAGYGTRLYPLTSNLPKPLVPINNTPIINFLIEKIDNLKRHFTISETRVVTNNKFYADFLDWKAKYKVEAKILNDGSNTPEERIGAIRDIGLAVEGEPEDWLVLGGDNLFKDDLVEFLKFSLKAKPYPCVGLYDVKDKAAAIHFGVVKCNLEGRITELKEKPQNPDSTLVATCIYFFPIGSLQFLSLYLNQAYHLDASGKYIEWLITKTNVRGYTLKGDWLDIGNKDSLQYAEGRFK